MQKIYLFLFLLTTITFSSSSAQQMQWLTSTPVNYSFNPDALNQPAFVSGNKLFAARLEAFNITFGSDIMGTISIDCYDTSGTLNWSYSLGDSAVIKNMIADAAGNVYVSGLYMETLHIGGTDSLVNTGFGFNTNMFMVSLDVSGNLRWKRNVTLSHADAFDVSSFAIDPMENCWYGIEYFDSVSIKRMDVNGNDVQSYVVLGTRTMGSFSFDSAGNIFLAGSSGSLTMTINPVTVNIPDPYMMFVARIDAAGNGSWIKPIHDVTFQSPQVVATVNGDAFMSGNLLQGASFGTVVLNGPQWVYDIFLVKVDSAGNFNWGVEVPQTVNITGDFQRGKNNFLDADASGNAYITGYIRGTVDWGNGVVSDAGGIPSDGMSVISFDGNGTARWQKTGKATGYISPHSLCVSATDECYFAASASGTATFDSLHTNAGGNLALVLGKISSQSVAGINDLKAAQSFTLYPNPADEQVSLSARQLTGTNKEASIYNVLGEKVYTNAVSGLLTIDCRLFPSGIYFIEQGNARSKFIVQHH
jgi:hypothetical protein